MLARLIEFCDERMVLQSARQCVPESDRSGTGYAAFGTVTEAWPLLTRFSMRPLPRQILLSRLSQVNNSNVVILRVAVFDKVAAFA